MSSAAKTLKLLAHFSVEQPEIGLSQLCRLAGRDKATTYRHLQALEETGLVEQNLLTKRYRLGPAVLQLAQTREVTVPRKAGAGAALQALADATGETAHVSILSGTTLYSLDYIESLQHSTRVIIDLPTFPLHATASGLCALAFGPLDLMEFAVANLTKFTPHTATSAQSLEAQVQRARDTGFGRSRGTLEDDVNSLSAPVFDQTGFFAGTVTVACVATRLTPDLDRTIQTNLVAASRQISRNWGGSIPPEVEACWSDALSNPHTLEPSP
ncbi:MAG TPA: IclR family transcriptional regulator [Roseibacterium sp.]|nr:IclR family transcriptional regulator [Roseibacterium sp.]